MSKDNSQPQPYINVENEKKFGTRNKLWNYPDLSANFYQSQNRTCCSPTDEIESAENEEEYSNAMYSVPVQTEKSAFLLRKQEKKNDFVLNKNGQDGYDYKKMHLLDNTEAKHYQTHENDNAKWRKSELKCERDKIQASVNPREAFDESTETDLDQPMDYALCYNETILDVDKKINVSQSHKNDYTCIEEATEEDKVVIIKPKGAFGKEPSKNKKEMFSNTSRSFKEIFNFFKDRDKKRSTNENVKPSIENPKLPKNIEPSEQKFLKCCQSVQPLSDQCEKESKLKNESQRSQQTPLMFSRCSSLGSLNGFEQNSVQDDRSSVISDFSRRTSGMVSPSELPDSPAQATALLGHKMQLKTQIGCFVKKKMFLSHQEKSKNSSPSSDNSVQQENILKMLPLAKRSVFEDNLTSFKDESTPTKLHSMAASSLSSLTIDDEDEFDIMNKIILNKEKPNLEMSKIENKKGDSIEKTDFDNIGLKSEKIENSVNNDEDNEDDEKNDELTDLTPYEEQLLDDCIRRGIAKWTKRNINEIKPFSWDVGLTCLATRTILNSRIRVNSYSEIDSNMENLTNHNIYETLENNNLKFDKNTQNTETESSNFAKYSNEDIDSTEHEMDLEESNDQFNENPCFITYEENLLDECIRRGMAKITKRHINDIKPFSWDANQICLTTRAMVLRSRDEEIYSFY